MARPRLDPAKQRQRQIGVRMNHAEWRMVDAAAKAAKLTPTAFVRSAALDAAVDTNGSERTLGRARIEEAIAGLRLEVHRCGVNLNQLTRLAHIGRDAKDALDVLEDLQAVLGRVLAGEGFPD